MSGFLHSHNAFSVPPWCPMSQHFIPFCSWIIFHHVTGYSTLCRSALSWWTFQLFPLWGHLWIRLQWTFMCKFICEHVFTRLGYVCRCEITGSSGNSIFNFLRNCQVVFYVLFIVKIREEKSSFVSFMQYIKYLVSSTLFDSVLFCQLRWIPSLLIVWLFKAVVHYSNLIARVQIKL